MFFFTRLRELEKQVNCLQDNQALIQMKLNSVQRPHPQRLRELENKISSLLAGQAVMKLEIRQLRCPHSITVVTKNKFNMPGYGREKCESCSKILTSYQTQELFLAARIKATTKILKELKETK